MLKHRFLAIASQNPLSGNDISTIDKFDKFIEQANSHHPTIKFTAEISNTETKFLDTVVYKGKRFRDQSPPSWI